MIPKPYLEWSGALIYSINYDNLMAPETEEDPEERHQDEEEDGLGNLPGNLDHLDGVAEEIDFEREATNAEPLASGGTVDTPRVQSAPIQDCPDDEAGLS